MMTPNQPPDRRGNSPSEATEEPRRQFLSTALTGAASGVVLSALAPGTAEGGDKGAGVQRTALHPPGAPAADSGYSPAIVAQGQRLLTISGQGPEDLNADMETQIRQTFDRIGILLKAAGASFDNVVMVRSYWVHIERDLPVFRKVRKDYLVAPYPASTAVGTPALAIPGLDLEIEVIALL
jgi:enamine deaminase RidA (YjgF/YER057c/UK114 family)